MSAEPGHSLSGVWDRRPRRNEGPLDHDHGQAENPRRFDLRHRRCAAGVFCQDGLDPMLAEQADVVSGREWAARLNEREAGQIKRHRGRIDQPDDVTMVRGGVQSAKREAAYAAKNDARTWAKRCDSGIHVRHAGPGIARLRIPRRPFDGEKRDARYRGRRDGIRAHLRGEGMRGIDQKLDALCIKTGREPFGAAKAAVPDRDGLSARRSCPARQRQDSLETGIGREQLCKRAGFGRAAQEKNAHGSRF